ncbi:MAG TPA: cation:proton antiporter [Candidatus Thermoplasmatota archaeon]
MSYELVLLLLGLLGLAAAFVPRILRRRPVSYSIVYVAVGILLGFVPLNLPEADPLRYSLATERLTELAVIVALMGSGLALGRRLGWRRWEVTWRLLAITMPLTIIGVALVGWWIVGLSPIAALLLGAVLAPTDPVLATDVQVGGPEHPDTSETRFALTSEAGLNDGLAFPFTNAALAALLAGTILGDWVVEWVWIDLLYKIGVGVAAGILFGAGLAYVMFGLPTKRPLAATSEGLIVLAITLVAYAGTQLLHGYGFVAVFVTAVVFRARERRHEYHDILHGFSGQAERTITAVVLTLFGAAIAHGLLSSLTWQMGLATAAILLAVRPVAGLAGLLGFEASTRTRIAIAFFGIRGLGSFYYLAFALNRADWPEAEALWSVVGLTVLASIVVHGVSARPAMKTIDAHGQDRPKHS